MATTSERVVVDRDAILNAVARMTATRSVVNALIGGSDSALTEQIGQAGWELYWRAFYPGHPSEPDFPADDPLYVEVEARSSELTAAYLAELGEEAELHAREARLYRERGTTSIGVEEA